MGGLSAPERDALEPLPGSVNCDVAIIGAGFTGLNAALALTRDHGLDVRVLEAGHIGWGALSGLGRSRDHTSGTATSA